MNLNFQKYSKWFRFLEYLFFPISSFSLITWGVNMGHYLIELIDFGYMSIYLLTFCIETIMHSLRNNRKIEDIYEKRIHMNRSKEKYTKWFYFINYLFFPVAMLSLIATETSQYNYIIRWSILMYVGLDLFTFVWLFVQKRRRRK